MKHVVQIIGGIYRGKKLAFPDVEGLRPTPNRVRETVFNWLMHRIPEAHCLDAFAGSGALGLEAFSRGATHVMFLEQSPEAYANLHKIISAFKNTHLKLIKTDALHYLQHSQDVFDVIFLDPPFEKNYLPQCILHLTLNPILKQGGLIYVESTDVIHLDAHHWRQIKLKKTGQVVYGLFEKLN